MFDLSNISVKICVTSLANQIAAQILSDYGCKVIKCKSDQ